MVDGMMEEIFMNSSLTEVENINIENLLGKGQIHTERIPSYIKSYSQTQIESTTIEYTWKIDQFLRFSIFMKTLISSPFPEEGQYRIQIIFSRQDDPSLDKIQFYILTTETFFALCTTTITYPSETFLSRVSKSGTFSNMTLLIDVPKLQFKSYTDSLIIHCKFEIFDKLINKTINMKLLPSSTVFSRDMRYVEDKSENEKLIKFIIGKEQYVISQKLLCAINSNYFQSICHTYAGKEKNMTNELTDDEIGAFKQILLFIITGLVEEHDDDILKKLLKAADKYDVAALKLTCEHNLLHRITINNAVELLQLAFSCNAKFLEMHSITFIKFHINEIINTEEFQNLPKENYNKITASLRKIK